MGFSPPGSPIERFDLLTKNIAVVATPAFYGPKIYREARSLVIGSRGHGATNDKAYPAVKAGWRQDRKRMVIPHLPAGLGVVINPDHIAAIGYPLGLRMDWPWAHGISSVPTGCQSMRSTGSSALGLNAASRSSKLSRGLTARIKTPSSTTESSTSWSSCRCACLAIAAGSLIPRLLPQRRSD